MASLKVEICLKKRNPPRAQIFQQFRFESRNKIGTIGRDKFRDRETYTT